MKSVIYCRVSSVSQTEGTSLSSQEAACKQVDPTADVVNEVFSGAYLHDRPELSKVRDRIKTGRYNKVICYAVDRLSRSSSDLRDMGRRDLTHTNKCDITIIMSKQF